MKWTFTTCRRRPSAGLLACRAKRSFGAGFAASDTHTRFSTDSMPEVPPRVDLVHNLLSHIPLTSTPGGSRDLLFNTPRSILEVVTPRGLPSTKVRHEEQASAQEEEMVDVTVLVEDNRSV